MRQTTRDTAFTFPWRAASLEAFFRGDTTATNDPERVFGVAIDKHCRLQHPGNVFEFRLPHCPCDVVRRLILPAKQRQEVVWVRGIWHELLKDLLERFRETLLVAVIPSEKRLCGDTVDEHVLDPPVDHLVDCGILLHTEPWIWIHNFLLSCSLSRFNTPRLGV